MPLSALRTVAGENRWVGSGFNGRCRLHSRLGSYLVWPLLIRRTEATDKPVSANPRNNLLSSPERPLNLSRKHVVGSLVPCRRVLDTVMFKHHPSCGVVTLPRQYGIGRVPILRLTDESLLDVSALGTVIRRVLAGTRRGFVRERPAG